MKNIRSLDPKLIFFPERELRRRLVRPCVSPAVITGVKVGVVSVTVMTGGIKVSVGRSMRSRTSFLRPVTVMGRSAGVRGSQVVGVT